MRAEASKGYGSELHPRIGKSNAETLHPVSHRGGYRTPTHFYWEFTRRLTYGAGTSTGRGKRTMSKANRYDKKIIVLHDKRVKRQGWTLGKGIRGYRTTMATNHEGNP